MADIPTHYINPEAVRWAVLAREPSEIWWAGHLLSSYSRGAAVSWKRAYSERAMCMGMYPMPHALVDNKVTEPPSPSIPAADSSAKTQNKRYAHGVAASCPHCGQRTIVRTSRLLSESFRELWAICPWCGFKGKAHLAWDLEASPSLSPNPKVRLPRMDYPAAVEAFAANDRDSEAGSGETQHPP